jgi:hypothetical protein
MPTTELDLTAVTTPGTIRSTTLSATPYKVRRILLPTRLGLDARREGMTLSIYPVTTEVRLLSAEDTTAEDADGTAITNYGPCPAGTWTTVALPLGSPSFRSLCSSTAGQVVKVEINRPVAL